MDTAHPELSPSDIQRLTRYGVLRQVRIGDILFNPGDRNYDFVVIVDAVVSVIQPDGDGELVLATHGAGRFLGELNILTGSQLMVTARVDAAGRILQIPNATLRHLLDTEAELSRVIVDAFLARRAHLEAGEGARSLQILGSRYSPDALELRRFAVRMHLPHTWIDLEDVVEVDDMLRLAGVEPADIPVIISPTWVLRRPTPAALADALGLSYEPIDGDVLDVVVVGAGPAGLAAAVYAASEGLRTLVIDAAGPGGQAGTSSLIENYLGFPHGISGRELTNLAVSQAQKFGARLTSPCDAVALTPGPQVHTLTLQDDRQVQARVVVIATGARYRRLALPGWERLEGAGIYYAATDTEVRICTDQRVAVVGGGNSAGQAALFLAEHAAHVDLVIRRDNLAETMSRYLTDRIHGHPHIQLITETQITGVHGDHRLQHIDMQHAAGTVTTTSCAGLFCFIGADAATTWLPDDIHLDEAGFILTDSALPAGAHGQAPLPLESSVPGVFAVGDVRQGSTKRVASAVGEGAAAIRSAHQHLAASQPAQPPTAAASDIRGMAPDG